MTTPEPDAPSHKPEPGASAAGEVPGWVTRLKEGPEYERRFFAQVVLAGIMWVLSSVVEGAVPLLRVLSGRRGVQTGPAIGSLLAFISGFVVASRVNSESPPQQVGSGTWGLIKNHSLEIAAVGLPALGAVLPMTVVARRRSPLLALALLPLPRIIGSALLAWSISRAKKRAETQPGQAAPPT